MNLRQYTHLVMNKVLFFLVAIVHIALGRDYGRRFPSLGGYDDPYGFSGLKGFLKKQREKQDEDSNAAEAKTTPEAEAKDIRHITNKENGKVDAKHEAGSAFERKQKELPKDWGWTLEDVLNDHCLF
uniref:Uncharacterized protein n=1 Tax=Leptocylindrus danicus TaxID=163516 RepID=A0A7S2LS26_9STRA|mmetsp:Transcript_8754/g.12954  ORF Transcript_8754/g.12954 Transcript_8754/m.12954 type:complete len:127 (+) Transcript_8754:57-437(+)